MKSVAIWCEEINTLAKEKGWWDADRQFPEIVALIHSEISEAFEEYRNGKPQFYLGAYSEDTGVSKPLGIAIELADIVIRVMDYCWRVGIDLEWAIETKHEYNKTRPYRHGGKQA